MVGFVVGLGLGLVLVVIVGRWAVRQGVKAGRAMGPEPQTLAGCVTVCSWTYWPPWDIGVTCRYDCSGSGGGGGFTVH